MSDFKKAFSLTDLETELETVNKSTIFRTLSLFNCNRCKNTFCLESISIPPIQLPDKFLLESVNFVMKGMCNECSRFVKKK